MACRQSKNISVALLCQALAAQPTGANASSRFEVGEGSRLQASTQVDFTIVIPEFVYLGGLRQVEVDDADRAIAVTPKGMSAQPNRRLSFPGLPVAMGNAGTLAFGRIGSDRAEWPGQDASPAEAVPNFSVAYLVAMP